MKTFEEYLNNTPPEKLQKDFDELEKWTNIGPSVEEYFKYIDSLPKQDYEDPCKGCPNNPRVNKFASGMCNCTLPYIKNPTIC